MIRSVRNPQVEGLKALVAKALIASMGAPLVERLGRFLVNRARLDFDNNLSSNGEMVLQSAVLHACVPQNGICVFDVGANVGDWTRKMASKVPPSINLKIHAFEPSPDTGRNLVKNISSAGLSEKVAIHHLAVGATVGRLELYSYGENQGRNSIYPVEGKDPEERMSVSCVTLDSFCTKNGIERIHLLKVDTEGNDALVLQGAREMLSRGAIEVVQFEYNARWIFARSFLRDVFELATPLGYRIGKLTPDGIVWFASWHSRLESFQEGNYVLALNALAECLPSIYLPGYSD